MYNACLVFNWFTGVRFMESLDLEDLMKKTIVEMVESGEITRESLREDGASDEEVEAFFREDLPKIRKSMKEKD